MPIYEYECIKCGQVEEVFQKFSDKAKTKCPHCSGKLHKLISQSTFHLKGSGWYVTDYASKSKNTGAPSKSGGEAPTETKTESKKAPEKSADNTS